MTSELRVDNLKGSTTGGSINVLGEGTSATTNLQQGLAKAWVNFNGTATVAIEDSVNVASITDHGTGIYSTTFTNAMNTERMAASGFARVSGLYGLFSAETDSTFTTTSFRHATLKYDNGSTGNEAADALIVTISIHGDLA